MMKFKYTCKCHDHKGKDLTYSKELITPTIETAKLVIEAWNVMGKGHFKYELGQSCPISREEKKNLVQSSCQPARYFPVDS